MIIKSARVVLQDGIKELDVKIEKGKIVELSDSLEGKNVIDAEGRYLMPAMVDIGVGVMDGKLRGGTLEKLSTKARMNGFGTVVLSSLCDPRIDNEITLEFARSQAELCRETKILSLLSGVKEEGGLSDCSILLKEGAVGIEFESHIDGNLIRRLMEYASMHGVKLFCRANDPALQGEGVMHEGEISCRLGLAGVPSVAESSQIARIGELAEFYGVDVVVLGASTERTLKICAQSGHLSAQVPIHHLILSDRACLDYDTAGKIWPPLRDEAMCAAMRDAVLKDDSAMITSLHTPVSETAKDAVFAEAAYGIEGLNVFLPLLYTFLVEKGGMDLPSLAAKTSLNPAAAVGLDGKKGAILPGYDADLLLFDPDFSFCYNDPQSPYDGVELRGRVVPV
ncbi:dihydroorotase [Hydrogenimonas sp.]|nr:dihydroorotase [Hydrogenimonas sp.]